MSNTITTDEAEEIYWGDKVAKQFVQEHRWYNRYIIVFKRGEDLYGFHYLDPATEMQEGQDLYDNDPVPIFPVTAREITKTVYEKTTDKETANS